MSDNDANGPTARDEARAVLQFAINTYGNRVLSNPSIIEGICEDKLPDSPREASLIANAAKSDVATMFSQQVGGVGPDTAVRLTAATLAQSRSLDPAGCVWVVSEFARTLGYEVSENLEPTAPSPPGVTVANPVATPTIAPTIIPTIAPTIYPEPPPVVTGPGLDPAATVPPYLGGTAGPQPSTGDRSRAKGLAPRLMLAVLAAAVIYVAVAAAEKLPPFAKAKPKAPGITQVARLTKLMPLSVRENQACSVITQKNKQFGSVASMVCNPATASQPYSYVAYYHFATQGALDSAYATFLAEIAKTTENTGKCPFGGGTATTFVAPCESAWVNAQQAVKGRDVEYDFDGTPELTFTDNHQLLLVDLQDSNGIAMVNWFAQSSDWLVGGDTAE